MENTKRRQRRSARWSRSSIRNALRASIALLIISVLAIIVIGLLVTNSIALAILFGVFGAILQAAFLGLVYEVWLRDEVEDATLEKLGTARDVREHGLIKFYTEPTIDWPTILTGAKFLTLVSAEPERLIGHFDNLLIRSAKAGTLEECRIVIPAHAWAGCLAWWERFERTWANDAPASSVFAVQLQGESGFDLIATETRTVVLLRPACAGANVEAFKVMEFRSRAEAGIGAWLSRQHEAAFSMSSSRGYSPPPAPPKGGSDAKVEAPVEAPVEDERLA